MSKWLFKTFMKIFMPDRRPGDHVKLAANFPQEDEYALSNLTHMSFYHFFYFPTNYKVYYNDFVHFGLLSMNEIEQWKQTYKKMVVKAAINTKGNRMILKNPVNTGRINRLIQIFPEARFIFMIRNPITVYLSSVKFFTQLFPTLNLEVYTRKDISEMVLDIYSKLLHDYLDLKEIIDPERLIEIRYEEFKSKPLTVLSDLYKKFDFKNFEDIEPDLVQYLFEQKNHKMHQYSIEKTELDKVLDKFEFAMNCWNYKIPENLDVIDNARHGSKNHVRSSKKDETHTFPKSGTNTVFVY